MSRVWFSLFRGKKWAIRRKRTVHIPSNVCSVLWDQWFSITGTWETVILSYCCISECIILWTKSDRHWLVLFDLLNWRSNQGPGRISTVSNSTKLIYECLSKSKDIKGGFIGVNGEKKGGAKLPFLLWSKSMWFRTWPQGTLVPWHHSSNIQLFTTLPHILENLRVI